MSSKSSLHAIGKLGGETVVYGLSGTISKFINFFLIPLYARAFSPLDYGFIGLISSLLSMFNTLVILGTDSAASRWYYDTQDTSQRRRVISSWFWWQVTVAASVVTLAFIFAASLADMLFKDRQYAFLVRIAVLTVPLTVFSTVTNKWYRYQRRPWGAMLFSVSASLLTIGATVLLVLGFKKGLVGFYSASLISHIFVCFISLIVLKNWISPRFAAQPVLKEMLAFSLPLIPASLAGWIRDSSDRLILQMFCDISSVGFYVFAQTLASSFALITASFQMAWGPFAYSIMHESNARRIYSQVLGVYTWLGCLLATTMSLFAPLLVQILATPKYIPSISMIPALVFSHLTLGVFYIVSVGLNIVKKPAPLGVGAFAAAGLGVVLNFVLVPFLGNQGAALAKLVANLAATSYIYLVSQRYYPIPFRIRDILVPFLLSAFFISVDRFFLGDSTLGSFFIRLSMCISFIPLAFGLGIIKPQSIRHMMVSLQARLSKSSRSGKVT